MFKDMFGTVPSVFWDHRRVNLYLRVWLGWCARRTQGFILVRAKRPYVQFAAARVTGTWFAVVTPSVLHRKSFTKTCHEHHVYGLIHVIKCVDQFL